MKGLRSYILLVSLLLLAGCAVNPVTGRNELALMSIPVEQEVKMGRDAYGQALQTMGNVYPDASLNAYVDQVGQRVARRSHRPEIKYSFKIVNDSAPNAFATGRDPEHAVVAVTTGILQKLERSELEGVIAHELSHIGNRDILLATIVTVLVGVVVLLADWFRRWTFWGGGRRRSSDKGGQLQIVIMVVAIVLSILAPIFAYMMQFAISRKREFLADADGALLTRYPEGLARALEKISADQEPLEVANRATAHLYIASPFKGNKKKGFFSKAFMTHPAVEERVANLRGMGNN